MFEAEIYIINQAGNVLFFYNPKATPEECDHPQMMASFLTAVLQFAKALRNDEISNFEMGKQKILITTNANLNLYYVIIMDKKDHKKIKNIDSILNGVRKGFEAKYPKEELMAWDGNTEQFCAFKDILVANFKKNVEDFFTTF